MRARHLLDAGVALLAAAAVHAQQVDAPMRFAYERPVITTGSGAQRLAIDVPLLAAGRPMAVVRRSEERWPRAQGGLADLRFFTPDGRPVPHLIIHAPEAEPLWNSGALLPVAATKETSGFEADFGAAAPIDMVRVEGLPAPFLKRLVMEGSGDRERWTMLAPEATLFDLPDEQLRQDALGFTGGPYRFVRVTWNDRNSGRLPMPRSVSARRVSTFAPAPVVTSSVSVETRPSEPGRSRYRLKLPGAHLPIVALDVDVAGGHVLRQAVVSESRLAGLEAAPAELGRKTITRVVRNGVAAAALRIAISPPREAELELTIENGSNPPLDLRGVTAVFAELPWIYLEAPDGAVVGRYGNPTAAAATYDLEAVRGTVNVTAAPEARWGEPRSRVESDAPSVAPPFPQTGAPLDVTPFRHSRNVADGGQGLVALPLDAAVLAHSRGPAMRFADVRVADASNRQVPYLVERRGEPLSIELRLAPAEPKVRELKNAPGNRSIYRVTLPYANLPGATLVFETSARVFTRQVQAGVERPPDQQRRDASYDVVASASWHHADQQTPSPALALALPRTDATELTIVVDEGDNSALPMTGARLLLPSYRLRFFKAAAPLRLLYGRGDVPAPQYDLALLAPQVMGAEAREIGLAAEPASTASGQVSFVSPRVFWILLAGAVIVLLALIAKLVR